MNEDRNQAPLGGYYPAPQPPADNYPMPDPPAQIEVGSRVDVRAVRQVVTTKKYFRMKADSEDTNWFIEWLLSVNHVYRNKKMKFIFNNLMFAASIGCFYMTIQRDHFYWLYPLFWVDFLLQFFSFYFYYMYPRQFRIRAYTFFRTSVYIHEVLSMLAKLLLFVIVDGYDGKPTEIAALIGAFCCILLFFTENFVYYNKAYDSLWNVPNCLAVAMVLLKVSGLVEISYGTAMFAYIGWATILYYLNLLTGLIWTVCFVGSIFGCIRPMNKVLFGYQALQSAETQMFCLLQMGVSYSLDPSTDILVSSRILGIFSLKLETLAVLLGVFQITIMMMQIFCQPESMHIEDFEGIPPVEERDLFVNESQNITVDLEASRLPGAGIAPDVLPTASDRTQVHQQVTVNIAPQTPVEPVAAVNSGNHDYPRMPGESSGQVRRSDNIPLTGAGARTGGALRFIHTASTMLSRQNPANTRHQANRVPPTRESFRPDEHDVSCGCCMTRTKDAMMMPCYHFAYCEICTRQILKNHKQTQDERARNNPQYVKKQFSCEFCKVIVKEIYQMRQLNAKEYITVSKIYQKEG